MSQEGPFIPSVTMMQKLNAQIEADKAAADTRAKVLANARHEIPLPENYPPNPLPPAPKIPDQVVDSKPVKSSPVSPESNAGAVVSTSS